MFAQELGPDINKHAPYALATMNWIKKKEANTNNSTMSSIFLRKGIMIGTP